MRFGILTGMFIFVLIGVVILIVGFLIAAVGIGVGWVLTQTFPFTLFEGTVIAILSLTIGWRGLSSLINSFLSFPFDDEDEDE